ELCCLHRRTRITRNVQSRRTLLSGCDENGGDCNSTSAAERADCELVREGRHVANCGVAAAGDQRDCVFGGIGEEEQFAGAALEATLALLTAFWRWRCSSQIGTALCASGKAD